MKNLILNVILAIFVSSFVVGQDDTTSVKPTSMKLDYQTIMFEELSQYNYGGNPSKMVIQPSVLNKNLKESFNTVVLSNTDKTNAGTAFGYTQDKDKGTFAFNTLFNTKSTKYFGKIGVHSTGSSSPFNIYTEDTWASEVGATAGFVFRIGKPSKYYSPNSVRELAIKRLKYADSLIKIKVEYSMLKEKIKIDTANLDKKKPNYWHKRDSLVNILKEIKKYDTIFKDEITTDLDELHAVIEENPKEFKGSKLELFLKKNNKDNKCKFIKNELAKFDERNNPTYGFRFQWIDINLTGSNATYKFKEENIDEKLFASSNESLGLDESQNQVKLNGTINYNIAKDWKKCLLYVKAGIGYNSGSFLSSNLILGTPTIDSNLRVVDEASNTSESNKGAFNEVPEHLQYGSFNAYGAIFFGEKKKIGLNLSLGHRYLINKTESTFYKKNFTVLLGPVFKALNAKGSGAIVGLDLGWDNAIYGTQVNDNFLARLKIGFPLNITK